MVVRVEVEKVGDGMVDMGLDGEGGGGDGAGTCATGWPGWLPGAAERTEGLGMLTAPPGWVPMGIWCGGGAAMLSTEWLVSPDTQSRTSAFIDSAFSDIPGDESVSSSSATVSSCDKAGWRELTRLAA